MSNITGLIIFKGNTSTTITSNHNTSTRIQLNLKLYQSSLQNSSFPSNSRQRIVNLEITKIKTFFYPAIICIFNLFFSYRKSGSWDNLSSSEGKGNSCDRVTNLDGKGIVVGGETGFWTSTTGVVGIVKGNVKSSWTCGYYIFI